jgi:hypothetical protein
MNKKEFATVKKLVREYMTTLNLDEVKQEFATKGLMTTNSKLAKDDDGNEVDSMTMNSGLELLPSVLSPINTCKGAGACKYECLAFSGTGNVLKSKAMFKNNELPAPLKSKARRTFLYINDLEWMLQCLEMEIRAFASKAKLMGKLPYFRLNVTSDLDWFDFTSYLSEFDFYDYTKIWNRQSTPNYHLTFSVSEKTTDAQISKKLAKGENVAVVFAFRKGKKRVMPVTYMGANVINGEKSDDRSLDKKGSVIGLLIKTPIGGIDKGSNFYRIVEEENPIFQMAA